MAFTLDNPDEPDFAITPGTNVDTREALTSRGSVLVVAFKNAAKIERAIYDPLAHPGRYGPICVGSAIG